MKLIVIVLIIGSTDISVDSYDFKKGDVSYSANIIHSNPQFPDQEAQSAFDVRFGSSPNFAQQQLQKSSLRQLYQNQYSQPSQAFNVGYSVSFTNGSPSKPKQVFPDIVLGSHKEQVVKPNYAPNQLELQPSSTTSWQTLGSGIEMFRSTNAANLDGANTIEHASNILNLDIPRTFDHAKALGGSQGFDYTDVLGINPMLQYNQNYNQQVTNIPQISNIPPIKYNQQLPSSAQIFNSPPANSVSINPLKDNIVSLGNLPGTNIVISDNLEAKLVPDSSAKLQKPANPNQEIVETFTANPTVYEDLNKKFKLNRPVFPLRAYQSPTPDLTPSYTQHYASREVERPEPDISYGFAPPPSKQIYRNYRNLETVYGQPHRYYSKNVDIGRVKNISYKKKFARAAMHPPTHRSLPRRKWMFNNRQMK